MSDIHDQDILDFVTKLLQPAARTRLAEVVEQGASSGPLVVEFDPTTACNFQCPECISLNLLNKGQIFPGRVFELLQEFGRSGVRGIIFIGGGEPLAHTSMPRPIEYARELGMSVGLTTNGSLIDKYLSAIAQCVHWTRVSVDAGTEDTFSHFRPSGMKMAFKRVIANVEELARRKTGILGFSFLLMERREGNGSTVTNCGELVTAAKLARDTGCDYFEFKPMVDEHHHLIPFSSHVRLLLSEALDQLDGLNCPTFRVVYPKSINHLLAATSPDQPKSYTWCPTLELRTVVTPSGIYPCPYKRGSEAVRLGSSQEPFDAWWPSAQRQESVRKIDPSKHCRFYCIRHESNVLLHHLAQAHLEGIDLLPYLVQTVATDDVFL